MKEGIEVLKPLVDKLIAMISNGVDFMSGQIPDVAKQILKFNAAMSGVWMAFGFFVIGLGVWLFRYIRDCDCAGTRSPYPCDHKGVAWIPLIICALPGTFTIMLNLHDLLQIWLAPKLYLIEYLKSILQPGGLR